MSGKNLSPEERAVVDEVREMREGFDRALRLKDEHIKKVKYEAGLQFTSMRRLICALLVSREVKPGDVLRLPLEAGEAYDPDWEHDIRTQEYVFVLREKQPMKPLAEE